MPFNRQNILYHPQGRGFNLITRFIILVLDILTVFLLCIAMGLWYQTIDKDSGYDFSDWNDPTVMAQILISLIWTLFVCLRPAWNSSPLHPGHYVAWELISWLFILGNALPALMLSDGIFDVIQFDDDDDPPDRTSVKGVEVTAYSLAFIVSFLHFILFIKACRVCEKHNKGKKLKKVDAAVELALAKKAGDDEV